MGILVDKFNNWKNRREEKRLDRLEGDIMKLADRIKYNPKFDKVFEEFNNAEEFTKRINENFIWFSAKPYQIRKFYLTHYDREDDLRMFWRTAPTNYRKVHSGVPKLLCTKMPIILFGGSYDLKVEVYKKDSEGKITDKIDEKLSKQTKDAILALCKKIDFQKKLESHAVNESRDGHTFAKFSYDSSLSEYPIYEVVDIRNAEVVKQRGITKSIIFKMWLNGDTNNSYCLHEIYTTEENTKYAKIVNKLYKLTSTGEVEVPLTDHEYTKDLKDEFVFEGIQGMLAFEKPNKLPNSEFIDSNYGDSDYAGGITAFDALDEVLSEIYAEIRNNKTIRYIPKSMLEKVVKFDDKGNPVTITKDLDPFITNYQKVEDSINENGESKIDITEIADKMESLSKKWQVAVTTVCNNAQISPLALGITGLEAINAGEASQRERNKATIETRTKKLALWKPYLEDFFIKLIELNTWMKKSLDIKQDGIDDLDIDWDNCNISVSFPDYITDTQAESINTWGSAKQMGVASTETAIDKIHKDWSDESKAEEVNRIKFEQGVSVDNPLNLPDLEHYNDTDDDEEKDNENKNKIDFQNPNPKKKDDEQ